MIFWKFKLMYFIINLFIFLCKCILFAVLFCQQYQISRQICKLGNVFNANEVCPWMLMRKCLLAILMLMLVILMLNQMLLNLNTGYADTDLCIRIMSLCCYKCDCMFLLSNFWYKIDCFLVICVFKFVTTWFMGGIIPSACNVNAVI